MTFDIYDEKVMKRRAYGKLIKVCSGLGANKLSKLEDVKTVYAADQQSLSPKISLGIIGSFSENIYQPSRCWRCIVSKKILVVHTMPAPHFVRIYTGVRAQESHNIFTHYIFTQPEHTKLYIVYCL